MLGNDGKRGFFFLAEILTLANMSKEQMSKVKKKKKTESLWQPLPVPGVGHGSHGLFQAFPTLYVQQHILLVTLKGSSFSQVVPL